MLQNVRLIQQYRIFVLPLKHVRTVYIEYYFFKQAHIITNLNFLMIISCVFLSSFIMLPPIKFCKYRKRGNVVWVAEPVPRAQCESLVKL